jgi:hypothetical protein
MSDNKRQGKVRQTKTKAAFVRRKKRKGMSEGDRPCLEPNAGYLLVKPVPG